MQPTLTMSTIYHAALNIPLQTAEAESTALKATLDRLAARVQAVASRAAAAEVVAARRLAMCQAKEELAAMDAARAAAE